MEGMDNKSCALCKCGHHKFVPILIILFGADFLLAAFGYISMEVRNMVWPVLIILAGFMKMGEGKCKCC